MKTYPESFQDSIDMTDGSTTIWEKDYKAIQLEALKEGMRRAAVITSWYFKKNRLHPDIPNENLNESARMAAHSILQQAAFEIVSVSDELGTKDL